jgi:DNA invertase Pin-like site-specific DNA recombinase
VVCVCNLSIVYSRSYEEGDLKRDKRRAWPFTSLKFLITGIAAAPEMERNLISERTSAVLQSKKARHAVYNHAPLGFDRLGSTLVENRDEQVTRIRHLPRSGEAHHK